MVENVIQIKSGITISHTMKKKKLPQQILAKIKWSAKHESSIFYLHLQLL